MGRVVAKEPCEKCGSKDNLARYEDGSGYCFTPGCGYKRGQDVEIKHDRKSNVQSSFDISNSIYEYQYGNDPSRAVSSVVAELFDTRYSVNSNGTVETIYYKYTNSNDSGTVSWKARRLPKDFTVIGGLQGVQLFGRGSFSPGGKRLVITEGEEDALAVAEAYHQYNGKIYPVVSIPSSSNLNPVRDDREFIRSFDEIILWVDKDEAGETAKNNIAKIIGYDKNIKIASSNEKDACDQFKKGYRTVLESIWNATKYNPQGILTSKELWKELENYNKIESTPYPAAFTGLNRALKGMRGGEITLWTSGTGAGKSTMLREIAWHLLQNTEDKVGIISLEESPAETAKKMAAMALNKNPAEENLSLTELRQGFDSVFGEDRVLVLDHAGAITESIVEQLNYMATQGCKYLFVDHITILVSEGSDGLTGNEAIDKVMNDLLKVAKTHNVWIGLVSHLRKMQTTGKSFEGGHMPSLDDIRGSGSIKQISNDIIAFSRNSEEGDTKIDMRVLKCRYTGLTGNAGCVEYDRDTGRLNPCEGSMDEDF